MARVRMRYQYDRRRNRKRTPPPTDGWLMNELCALTVVSPSTVKRYIKLGMLAHPIFRGRATRYDRNALLRLTAIHQLKLNGTTGLLPLRRALDEVVAWGLERWVMAQPMPQRIAEVLRPRTPPNATTTNPSTPAPAEATNATGERKPEVVSPTERAPTASNEGWQTIVLLPGLQLRISANSGEAVRKVAVALCERVSALAAAGV